MKSMWIPLNRVSTLLSLSLSLLCCLPALLCAEETSRHQFPPAETNRDWIAAELNKEQLKYLQGEQKFFSLFAEERWGKPKGAVLIIPDPDEIPWPEHLLELHQQLADYGWHSLIISLPIHDEGSKMQPATNKQTSKLSTSPALKASTAAKSTNTLSTDGSSSESMETGTESGDDQPGLMTSADPYIAAVQKRLDAAIAYLHTKGQFNIAIVASGRSGQYAEELLERQLISSHEQGVNPLQAVILINADSGTGKWIKKLAGLPLPLLDIYYSGTEADQQAALRRSKFKRQRKPVYNQVALPKPLDNGSSLNPRLARRCRGWLDQHIAGREAHNLVKLR